jgi:actin-related protein
VRRPGTAPGVTLQAISGCPRVLQPALWCSIALVGGNACLPGLEARLQRELRQLAPAEFDVNMFTPAK